MGPVWTIHWAICFMMFATQIGSSPNPPAVVFYQPPRIVAVTSAQFFDPLWFANVSNSLNQQATGFPDAPSC
jgi:hypothetical protein